MSPRPPWIVAPVLVGGAAWVFAVTRASGPAYLLPFEPLGWCASSHAHPAFGFVADWVLRIAPGPAAANLQWLTAAATLACGLGLAWLLLSAGSSALTSTLAAFAFLLSRDVWQEATRTSAEPFGVALIILAFWVSVRARATWRAGLVATALTAVAVADAPSLLVFIPALIAAAALRSPSDRYRKVGLAAAALAALAVLPWSPPTVSLHPAGVRDLLTRFQALGAVLVAIGIASGLTRLTRAAGWVAAGAAVLAFLPAMLSGPAGPSPAAAWPWWLLIGIGLTWAGHVSPRRDLVAGALGVTLAVSALVSNWAWADRSRDDLGRRFVLAASASLPAEVVLAAQPGVGRDLARCIRADMAMAGRRALLTDLSAARIARHLVQGREAAVLTDGATPPAMPGYAIEVIPLHDVPLPDYLRSVPRGEWLALATTGPAWMRLAEPVRIALALACGFNDVGTEPRNLACVLQSGDDGALVTDRKAGEAEVHVLPADALGPRPAFSPLDVQAVASGDLALIRHNGTDVVSAPGIAVARFSRDGRLREVRGLTPGEERGFLSAEPWHLVRYVKQ